LQSDGSLSRRLSLTFGDFKVQLLGQGTAPVTDDELHVLRKHGVGRCGLQRCHVREVVLWGKGRPLVHARSVLPAVQARLTWRALRGLGQRPLADLLFGLRAAHCTRLGGQRMAPLQARRLGARLGWTEHPLWCRRSVFTRRGVPLLVTEWFAPTVRDHAPGINTCPGKPRNVRQR
jgi:chorismate--pyruvate lyase